MTVLQIHSSQPPGDILLFLTGEEVSQTQLVQLCVRKFDSY